MAKANGGIELLVLPGDGIGHEISASTVAVVEEVSRLLDLGISVRQMDIGLKTLQSQGTTFPDEVWTAVQQSDAVVLGPCSRHAYPPVDRGGVGVSGEMRKRLDLHANIRPAKVRPGVTPPCGKTFDLVIARENTEGFYTDRNMYQGLGEYMPTPDVALGTRKITRQGSMRIAETAFKLAVERRSKVSVVTKSNVLKYTDGLFLECVRDVARNYPAVELEERYIDSTAAYLVRNPASFDVILTTNMFGDILSDLASELSGSLGLGAAINAGERFVIAQAQHGSAPDIEGRDLANPVALVSSAGMLLGWLGSSRGNPKLLDAARLIEAAIDATLANPQTRTRDLGGTLGTREFTRELTARIGAMARGTDATSSMRAPAA